MRLIGSSNLETEQSGSAEWMPLDSIQWIASTEYQTNEINRRGINDGINDDWPPRRSDTRHPLDTI